jgi:hypothetical protein
MLHRTHHLLQDHQVLEELIVVRRLPLFAKFKHPPMSSFHKLGYLADESARKGSAAFWNLDYYQSYFDVDTKTVSAL